MSYPHAFSKVFGANVSERAKSFSNLGQRMSPTFVARVPYPWPLDYRAALRFALSMPAVPSHYGAVYVSKTVTFLNTLPFQRDLWRNLEKELVTGSWKGLILVSLSTGPRIM